MPKNHGMVGAGGVLGGKSRFPVLKIRRVRFSKPGGGLGSCICNEHFRPHLVDRNIALDAGQSPNSILQVLDIKQPESGETLWGLK